MKKLLIVGLLLAGNLIVNQAVPAWSESKTAEQYLTKGEAIQLLSASDLMRKKVGELLSWTVGYDISKVSRARLTPIINYVKAIPRRIPPDGRTILEVTASVDDPGGLKNIAGVRADLSSIGRLPNTMLVDNGLFGDEKTGDGIYTLQTSVSPKIALGSKDIPVAAANKKGWLALAKTSLEVRKNPAIIEKTIFPDKIVSDGKTTVSIVLKLDNPGRGQDINSVTGNFQAFGLGSQVPLALESLGEEEQIEEATYMIQFTMPLGIAANTYLIPITMTNIAGGRATENLEISVGK